MKNIDLFGAIESWLLGVLDTAFGTKNSMMICTVLMILSGILGVVDCNTGTAALVVVSLVLLAMFMRAFSNYTVSEAVQYSRREDFASVFAAGRAPSPSMMPRHWKAIRLRALPGIWQKVKL